MCDDVRKKAEEIFRLAEQMPDPQVFLQEILEYAKRLQNKESVPDESFLQWKKENGYV